MKNSTLLVSVGLAAGLLATPAFAQFDDCQGNLGSYEHMSMEQQSHVFIARNSNKGKGNGGEGLSLTLDPLAPRGFVIDACIETADEGTGGTVDNIGPLGPELDPGKGNQPPEA